MSELALDGPHKDEVPFTIWLQWLSPNPHCWRKGWRDFHVKQEPGKPVLLTAGWRLVGVVWKQAVFVFGDTPCPLQRVLMRWRELCTVGGVVQSAQLAELCQYPQRIAQHPGDINILIVVVYMSFFFIHPQWVFIVFCRSSTGRRQPKQLITHKLCGPPLLRFRILTAEVKQMWWFFIGHIVQGYHLPGQLERNCSPSLEGLEVSWSLWLIYRDMNFAVVVVMVHFPTY